MRYLAIDYGRRYLGTALTDADGIISFPHIRFDSKGKWEEKIRFIEDVIREKEIKTIVIGQPFHLDGGFRDSVVMEEINKLQSQLTALGYKVDLFDERYSTFGAKTMLQQLNLKKGRTSQNLDCMAASLILETYLQRLKNRRE